MHDWIGSIDHPLGYDTSRLAATLALHIRPKTMVAMSSAGIQIPSHPTRLSQRARRRLDIAPCQNALPSKGPSKKPGSVMPIEDEGDTGTDALIASVTTAGGGRGGLGGGERGSGGKTVNSGA